MTTVSLCLRRYIARMRRSDRLSMTTPMNGTQRCLQILQLRTTSRWRLSKHRQRPPPVDPSVPARLEVHDIRYRLYSANLSFTRPHVLEFSSWPQVPLVPGAYIYSGILNQRPYSLSNTPANALFLEQEKRLHLWAQRLVQLSKACPEDDYNNRRQIRSVEKDVISALNKMFAWKSELYAKVGPPEPPLPGQRPVINTSKFNPCPSSGVR